MKKKLVLAVIIMTLVIATSICGLNIYAASKLPSDGMIPDGNFNCQIPECEATYRPLCIRSLPPNSNYCPREKKMSS